MAQTVKRLSTMWETWVRALSWEDPLEKEMAIHPSTIAWKIPWTEEPGRLQSMGSQSRTRLSDFIVNIYLYIFIIFPLWDKINKKNKYTFCFLMENLVQESKG